jgi:hypothetical protein
MRYFIVSLITVLLFTARASAQPAHNTLTDVEKKDGWRLLFDGRSTAGWRGYRKAGFPQQGWTVEEGCLKKVGGVLGGDIITVEKFTDFEFQWEWRIGPKGNNGIKYLVTEERPGAPGPEYQMIDDVLHATPEERKFSTASFYYVLPPADDKPLNPPGQWNHSKLRIQGNKVQHWLNGRNVLEYELESEPVRAAIAQSKFKDAPGFGTKITGHLMLTDHKDECWFRNLKLRD